MTKIKKIGCFLIGWNPEILEQCGEASQRQYRKLLSAIFIMIIMWGTIGYCFADRYIGIQPVLPKIAISLVFMFIILCVERVIILTVGKATMMAVMRVALALCMAVLGSCIFDQIIFSNDIKQAIQDKREDLIQQTINKRLAIYDADMRKINASIDTLNAKNEALYKELAANPTSVITTVSTSEQVAGTDANGNARKVKVHNVNKTVVPNPRAEQAKGNEQQLNIYNQQLETLRNNKRDIDKTTRAEIQARPQGFIEELEATLHVISNSWISLAFYIILFLFLTFLELFVLTIKFGDNKCDYEIIVERQLKLKENMISSTENRLQRIAV